MCLLVVVTTVQHVGDALVTDVEQALQDAERLGGTRVLGPAAAPSGLAVGQFSDPAGNIVGLAALPDQDG